MSSEPQNRYDGSTIEETLARLPGDLVGDAVPLWGVVSKGNQAFGLTGNALTDFVRRGILAILREGGEPVVGAKGRIGWDRVDYGSSSDAIVDAIIKEWIASGGGTHTDPRGLWFALPEEIDRP